MRSLLVLTILSLADFSAAFTSHSFRSTVSRQRTRVSACDEDNNDNDPSVVSRREAIQNAGLALSSMLLIPASATTLSPLAAHAEGEPKTIILTGSNSGIGFEAVKRLSADGHTVVMPCRTMEKSLGAIQRIGSTAGNLVPAECDLASLASIQAFAKELPSLLGSNKKIDILGLNAGLARDTSAVDVARTKDGFELTVGTNHFGHFALNKLLLPMMNPNGKIVITASGVHDPESPGGAQGEKATLGDLEGLKRDGKLFEMVDGASFNADKAYKDSKLCNVLFTRELQKRLEASDETKRITANCFNPGLIVSTGLFRDQNPLFTKVFDVVATDVFKVGETPTFGGGTLYYTTTVDTRGGYYSSAPGSSKYGDAALGNQFAETQCSKEASDDAKAKNLWDLTDSLIGL
ncbi:Protochlorophyllide reductase A, chloroplastic [Seminavis robusta]|uniref:Protochlorophyllide reductase A, chloroplastic n=1 Tax=Seminavis robusta TaxID=568900 RepID=A0A9N8EPJ8_9STRA|nr:Protochlorophyllide reductase A, chloroplastic [Seminavis robusta]|eukprot:Sro1606_g285490.1 Protochlorophyllide reductase A, chloroplastic (406) ;mRNA; r:7634-9181